MEEIGFCEPARFHDDLPSSASSPFNAIGNRIVATASLYQPVPTASFKKAMC
jgi:hypothetical protein